MTEEVEFVREKNFAVRKSLMNRLESWIYRRVHFLIILITLAAAAYLCVECWMAGQFPPLQMSMMTVTLLIGLWVLHGVFMLNRPIRRRGIDPETNKSLIDRQLRESYPDFHFHLRESEMLSIRLWTMDRPGKEIRIYLDEKYIKVNVKTRLRYGLVESPYHVLANRRESREILRDFKSRAMLQTAA